MKEENENARMKARISLLEDSLRGLEELLIHMVEKQEAEKKAGASWRKRVPVTPQA